MSTWQKQGDQPLFPDLLWSRPENRRQAGKLLIIGGNAHGFAAPALAYQVAGQAGAGTIRVLLPDALQKTVGKMITHGEFAASTPSGSFSRAALSAWLEHAAWADAILLAGDLGRNSETAIAVETLTQRFTGLLIITKDAVDYFYTNPEPLLRRKHTTLVLSFSQLQKIARQARWPHALTFDLGLAQVVDWLAMFTADYQVNIVTYHNENIFVATNGQVSSTKVDEQETWRVATAAQAAVWQLQNPDKPFQALTSSVFSGIIK